MNKGFDLEKERLDVEDTDWVFGGASLVCLAPVPPKEREANLPKGEVQRGREDFMDCASRAPLNILEDKFNWLLRNGRLKHEAWFREQGYITENGFEFSDRFIAILSGTTRSGNSLKAPCQAIHEYGLIPKSKLPARKSMTWDEYHNREDVTGSLLALGEQFKTRFTINYERVYDESYRTLLDEDMLIFAGHAWPTPRKGEYPRTNDPINHAFAGIRSPLYYIFDNYEESPGDFIKKLAKDYNLLNYGYRLYISETKEVPNGGVLSLIKQAALLLREYIGLKLGGGPNDVDGIIARINQLRAALESLRQTNRIRLYETARQHLGVDVTPGDKVNDEVACAEVVSTLLSRVIPGFPILPGTFTLNEYFKRRSDLFTLTTTPKFGDLVISPTMGKNVGHVGIVGKDSRIMSNNSLLPKKGIFLENYTIGSWYEYFVRRKGLKVFYYTLK